MANMFYFTITVNLNDLDVKKLEQFKPIINGNNVKLLSKTFTTELDCRVAAITNMKEFEVALKRSSRAKFLLAYNTNPHYENESEPTTEWPLDLAARIYLLRKTALHGKVKAPVSAEIRVDSTLAVHMRDSAPTTMQ